MGKSTIRQTSPRPGIACPHCSERFSSVVRTIPRDANLQRVRKCLNAKCGKKFTTRETTSKALNDTNSTPAVISVDMLMKVIRTIPPAVPTLVTFGQEDKPCS